MGFVFHNDDKNLHSDEKTLFYASLYIDRNDFSSALKVLGEIEDTNSPDYLYTKGLCYYNQRQTKNGVKYLNLAAKAGNFVAILYLLEKSIDIDDIFNDVMYTATDEHIQRDLDVVAKILNRLLENFSPDYDILAFDLFLDDQLPAGIIYSFIKFFTVINRDTMPSLVLKNQQLSLVSRAAPYNPFLYYLLAMRTNDKVGYYKKFLSSLSESAKDLKDYEPYIKIVVTYLIDKQKNLPIDQFISQFSKIKDNYPELYTIIMEIILKSELIRRRPQCDECCEDVEFDHEIYTSNIDTIIRHFSEPGILDSSKEAINDIIDHNIKIDIDRVFPYLNEKNTEYYISLYMKMRKIVETERINIECINCIQDRDCIPYVCGHYTCDDCYDSRCRLCRDE